jgi:hypothetical protein
MDVTVQDAAEREFVRALSGKIRATGFHSRGSSRKKMLGEGQRGEENCLFGSNRSFELVHSYTPEDQIHHQIE